MPETIAPKSKQPFRPAKRAETSASLAPPWPILVVDDEPDVHAMTRVLLRDMTFQGRGFEVVSAYSAAEARQILAVRPDIPVTLLDVVMETADAGLALVEHIRRDMGNNRLAIVLRTGQPGEAPEREVMLAYDINDYRGKTELTAQKLFTALVGGLRSWSNLSTIESLNTTLEQKVEQRTQEVECARRFAENLVDMLPHPVWYKDSSGELRLYNRAFRELFQLPEDGAGTPSQLKHLDSLPQTSGAESSTAQEVSLEIGGEQRSVMISKTVFHSGCATQTGTVSLLTDITEHKRMERQLRKLATIDDLTGTLNRRAFFAAAEQEMERALRYGNAVSVVMFDLDHFKQVNDRYGHALGDQALREAATALRAKLRDVDILGRLGGEEFAILLPETPLSGAVDVAERLRHAIAALRIARDNGQAALTLTASLGVAERLAEEITVDKVLARADLALYRAKADGRNRVTA